MYYFLNALIIFQQIFFLSCHRNLIEHCLKDIKRIKIIKRGIKRILKEHHISCWLFGPVPIYCSNCRWVFQFWNFCSNPGYTKLVINEESIMIWTQNLQQRINKAEGTWEHQKKIQHRCHGGRFSNIYWI